MGEYLYENLFMKSLNKIINEEIVQYLREYDDDVDWDLYDKLEDVKYGILDDFLKNKKRGIKKQPWTLIPFARLRKIWEDYMAYGHVRDTRGLEMIEDIIQTNILKLYVNTQLVGHTSVDPSEDFDSFNYSEQDREDFADHIDKFSDYAFSDFGGSRLGLLTLLQQLRKAKTPEEKVPIIDQILNVVHQRSDLASWFVEGGSSALSQLSGSPSEVPA